jgi:hypothetical protein
MDLCIQTHSHHSNAVTAVLFVDNVIVTGSLDGSITLINMNYSEIIDRISVPTKCGGVTCISPSSAEAATGTFIAGTESGRLAKVSFSDATVSRDAIIIPPQSLQSMQLIAPRCTTAGHTRRRSRESTAALR